MDDNGNEYILDALFGLGCIGFNIQEPFALSGGARWPLHVDTSKLLSSMRIFGGVAARMCEQVKRLTPATTFHGIEASSIPLATALGFAALADGESATGFVRKAPKEHGRRRPYEGVAIDHATRTVLVENVISTGSAAIRSANVLQNAGARIELVTCLVNHNLPNREGQRAGDMLCTQLGLPVYAHFIAREVSRAACARGLISQQEEKVFSALCAMLGCCMERALDVLYGDEHYYRDFIRGQINAA